MDITSRKAYVLQTRATETDFAPLVSEFLGRRQKDPPRDGSSGAPAVRRRLPLSKVVDQVEVLRVPKSEKYHKEWDKYGGLRELAPTGRNHLRDWLGRVQLETPSGYRSPGGAASPSFLRFTHHDSSIPPSTTGAAPSGSATTTRTLWKDEEILRVVEELYDLRTRGFTTFTDAGMTWDQSELVVTQWYRELEKSQNWIDRFGTKFVSDEATASNLFSFSAKKATDHLNLPLPGLHIELPIVRGTSTPVLQPGTAISVVTTSPEIGQVSPEPNTAAFGGFGELTAFLRGEAADAGRGYDDLGGDMTWREAMEKLLERKKKLSQRKHEWVWKHLRKSAKKKGAVYHMGKLNAGLKALYDAQLTDDIDLGCQAVSVQAFREPRQTAFAGDQSSRTSEPRRSSSAPGRTSVGGTAATAFASGIFYTERVDALEMIFDEQYDDVDKAIDGVRERIKDQEKPDLSHLPDLSRPEVRWRVQFRKGLAKATADMLREFHFDLEWVANAPGGLHLSAHTGGGPAAAAGSVGGGENYASASQQEGQEGLQSDINSGLLAGERALALLGMAINPVEYVLPTKWRNRANYRAATGHEIVDDARFATARREHIKTTVQQHLPSLRLFVKDKAYRDRATKEGDDEALFQAMVPKMFEQGDTTRGSFKQRSESKASLASGIDSIAASNPVSTHDYEQAGSPERLLTDSTSTMAALRPRAVLCRDVDREDVVKVRCMSLCGVPLLYCSK